MALSIFGSFIMPRSKLLRMIVLLLWLFLHQAVHFAAQYGQTGFLNHIVTRYGADFDAPDNDGRSPLHWYADLRVTHANFSSHD